jgi:cobalt/nickel transport system permease protein
VEFAIILLVKVVVCVSAIILLSSITKLHDMLEGAGRMGLPPEFALTFGMMIRYLFVFGYIYRKINESMTTRCFDPFNAALSYRYRLKQIGYTVGTIFIRSYEQGERVYTSMLCRGYGRDSHIFIAKKPLRAGEWSFLLFCLIFAVSVPLTIWLTAISLF